MKRVNWKQQKLSFVPKLISDAVVTVVEVEPEEPILQADDCDTSEQSVRPNTSIAANAGENSDEVSSQNLTAFLELVF